MSLVEQIRSMSVTEVELIVEVDTARHEVLGECVCCLEAHSSAKTPLCLHEKRVVIVQARRDECVNLPKVGIDPAFLQHPRIQIWQDELAPVAIPDIRRAAGAQYVCGLP